MHTLVIGASGYLGSAVVNALQADESGGHRVSALIRPQSKSLMPSGVEVHRGELESGDGLARALRDVDAVVFCARLLDDGHDRSAERRIVERLIQLLRGSDAALVFTSGTGVLSSETAGHWEDRVLAEDDPFEPALLMQTRVGTEQLVRDSAAQGVRGMVIRPPSIWGNGLSSHTTHIVRTVVELGTAWHVGPGLNSYSVVHVDDLARLFRLAIERGRPGATYHAAAGEVPNRWLAETVADALGVKMSSVTPEEAAGFWGDYVTRVVMGSSSRTTSARTRAELGWSPVHFDMLANTHALLLSMAGDSVRLQQALGRRPVPTGR
jgi:nucleoside-diphosphate-sugar epimerase